MSNSIFPTQTATKSPWLRTAAGFGVIARVEALRNGVGHGVLSRDAIDYFVICGTNGGKAGLEGDFLTGLVVFPSQAPAYAHLLPGSTSEQVGEKLVFECGGEQALPTKRGGYSEDTC